MVIYMNCDNSMGLTIPEISSDCQFWMVRTKRGVFFDEFLRDEFVAIGWNSIDQQKLKSEKCDKLKQEIQETYGEKRPGTAYNKCNRFVNELKINDILMIVGNTRIIFATAGAYFEEKGDKQTIERELEIDGIIDSHFDESLSLSCPYIKRRHITIISVADRDYISPYLFKAMIGNYHSLSSINEYAPLVLSSAFDIFVFRRELSITFRVCQEGQIDSIAIADFIGSVARILSDNGAQSIAFQASIHSPGDISFIVPIFDCVKSLGGIAAIYFAIFGGEFKGVKFPSVCSFIQWLCDRQHEKAMQKEAEVSANLGNKKIEQEIENQRLQNLKLAQEISEKIVPDSLKQIHSSAQKLKIESNIEGIIPLPQGGQKAEKDGTIPSQ